MPPSAYTQATERYEAVGNWLLAEGSSLRASDPVVYPQGSFAIGTVVRPLLGDDYDLDAVVQLADPRQLWTPATLKSSVGERLQEHATYRRLLQGEGRRCWTLNYSAVDARHGFHLDLLPSVPSATQPSQTGRPDQSVTPNASVTAIAITNRVSPLKVEWCESDPKGYAAWFERRMIPLTERNDMFAGDRLAGVEAVRQVTSRTPLQYVIQLLKRHRDVLFLGKGEHAPISIIITTLAAMAYEGEDTIEGALLGVVSRLGRGIEQRAGEIFIRNPVRPTENFADRWRGDPKKVTAFTSWVQATRDFASRLQAGTSAALQGELEKALGESSAKEAMAKFAARRTRGDSAVFLHQPASLTETSGVFLRGVTGARPGSASAEHVSAS